MTGRTPETPDKGGDLSVTKLQSGYGAPVMSLIDSVMVGNVALGEFGRGGGMYANDGVVRHMNSKVTQNKAASGGGLYMGKAGLFELIEIPNCGIGDPDQEEENEDAAVADGSGSGSSGSGSTYIKCSADLLIQSNEACRVDQGFDSCAVQKLTPTRDNMNPKCPSETCRTFNKFTCPGSIDYKFINGNKIDEAHKYCTWNQDSEKCTTLIQTPMNFGTWGDDKACAARLSGRGLFRGGNINVEGDVTLDGMSITYGRAELGGAVYINVGSKSTLSRCTIQYNRAMDKGGGIYFGFQAEVKLVEMIISENHAKLGGGLFLDRCKGEHFNLNVTRNTASEAGGGMYLLQSSTMLGSNSTLGANLIQAQEDEANVMPVGGAGVYINGNGFNLQGFDVIDSTSEKGGGIFIESESSGLLKHMRVAFNIATESQGGGGLYISKNSNIRLEESKIEQNKAAEGGAMSIDSANVQIVKVKFFNNTAEGNGGGIIVKGENAVVQIDSSTFESNNALSGDGGGIALTDSKKPTIPPMCDIQNTIFRKNNALSGNGGNIMVSKSMKLNIKNSVIACQPIWKNGDGDVMLGSIAPSAINGGGMYYGSGTNGTILGVSVRGCKAEQGGGMYVVESNNVYIGKDRVRGTRSVFQYNIADFGGAISASLKASLNIEEMTIKENRANYDGAGIHVEDTYINIKDV